MNAEIRIVRATPEDIPLLYQTGLELFADDPWPIDWFIEGVNDEEGYYYKALLGNELAGYCGMYHITSKTPNYCKIATLGVKQKFRKQGIGKALLITMLNTAEGLGLRRAKLEVNTKNSAIKLYEALGFQIEEFKEHYFEKSGGDAYIMWRYAQEDKA